MARAARWPDETWIRTAPSAVNVSQGRTGNSDRPSPGEAKRYCDPGNGRADGSKAHQDAARTASPANDQGPPPIARRQQAATTPDRAIPWRMSADQVGRLEAWRARLNVIPSTANARPKAVALASERRFEPATTAPTEANSRAEPRPPTNFTPSCPRTGACPKT